MLLQLSHHCEECNLQLDYQSDYRANYSCKTALLGISNDILWAQERQSIVSLVAIDLSVAFDTVNHDILLDIQDLLIDKPTSRRGLRSYTKNLDLLLIPPTKHNTFADRSFSVAAPRLWNDLPNHIKQAKNMLTFKRDLKTHLYKQAFC